MRYYNIRIASAKARLPAAGRHINKFDDVVLVSQKGGFAVLRPQAQLFANNSFVTKPCTQTSMPFAGNRPATPERALGSTMEEIREQCK